MPLSEIVIACAWVAYGSSPVAAVKPQPTIQVPTKLAIKRTADTLTVAIDPSARESIPLVLDPKLVVGVKSSLRVHPVGSPATGDGEIGLASGLDFNIGERIFHRAQDGLPVAGTHYVVELDIAVFETDVPPGHMWAPQDSPRYKVRWKRTLTARVD
jgi:hypothetical protein